MDGFWKGVKNTPAPALNNFGNLEAAILGVMEHILYPHELSSKQIKKLAGWLPDAKNVTALRLPYCFLQRTDFQTLLAGIVKNPSIQWLHLCCAEPLDENTTDAMVKYLRFNEVLSILHFRWSKNLDSTSFMTTLEKSFSTNETLAELSLRNSKIGPFGTDSLARLLNANDSIRILDLARTNLSDECVAKICRAITGKKKLGELDLSRNNITQIGTRALKTLLCESESSELYKLSLALNPLKDGGAYDMAEVLRLNKKLTTLDLTKAGIKNNGIRSLADALSGGFDSAGNLTIHKLLVKQTGSIDATHLQKIQVALKRNEADRIKALEATITGNSTSSWNFGKLMVVGPAGSGKTATVNSLLGGTFVPVHNATVGINMLHVKVSTHDGWKKDKSTNFAESFIAKIKYENHQQEVQKREDAALERASSFGSGIGTAAALREEQQEQISPARVERQESRFPGFGDNDEEKEQEELHVAMREKEYVDASNEEKTLRVAIWDYGGNRVLHSVHHLFLSRFGVYLVVFSMVEYRENRQRTEAYLRFWLHNIYLHAQNAQILIVGTHAGGVSFDEYSSMCESLQEITQRMQSIIRTPEGKLVFPIENKKKTGVNALKESIVNTFQVQTLVNRVIPLSWVRALDAMNNQDKYFLRYSTVKKIMKEQGVKLKEIDIVLGHFHQLGLLYHFRNTESLSDKIILEPGWLVEEITRVIRDKRKHPKVDLKEARRLDLEKDAKELYDSALASRRFLAYVWHGEEEFMIDLMKSHLLMDDWPWISGSDEEEEKYFVPAMAKSLRKARKDDLPQARPFAAIFSLAPSAVYQFPYLPEGVFQRLVCDCIHQAVNTNMDGSKPFPEPIVLKDAIQFSFSDNCRVTLAIDVAVFPKKPEGEKDVTPQRVWSWAVLADEGAEGLDELHGVHNMIIASLAKIREEMFAEDFFPRELSKQEILQLRDTFGPVTGANVTV